MQVSVTDEITGGLLLQARISICISRVTLPILTPLRHSSTTKAMLYSPCMIGVSQITSPEKGLIENELLADGCEKPGISIPPVVLQLTRR